MRGPLLRARIVVLERTERIQRVQHIAREIARVSSPTDMRIIPGVTPHSSSSLLGIPP